MVKPSRPAANGFVAAMRYVYNPLGFSKGYNFVLFFITMGCVLASPYASNANPSLTVNIPRYLFGFTLARMSYLSFYGVFCNPNSNGSTGAAPGECCPCSPEYDSQKVRDIC